MSEANLKMDMEFDENIFLTQFGVTCAGQGAQVEEYQQEEVPESVPDYQAGEGERQSIDISDAVAAALQVALAPEGEVSRYPSENIPINQTVKPTVTDCGLSVTIFGMKQAIGNALLKNKTSAVCEGPGAGKEKVVVVRASQIGKSLPPLEKDFCSVVMPCSAYMRFLEFLDTTWPIVCKKILDECNDESGSETDCMSSQYKWHKYEKGSTVYLGSGGPVGHTYVLYQTPKNQVLKFQTRCFASPGIQPSLCMSLGWSDEALGNVTLTSKALGALVKDLGVVRSLLMGQKEKAERSLLKNQPLQQQQQQPKSLASANRPRGNGPPAPPAPPVPPRRPRTPGSNIPMPLMTAATSGAKKRKNL